VVACCALGALLAGCGGSSHKQTARADSATSSPAQTSTATGAAQRIESITPNGAVVVVSPGTTYSVESEDWRTASSFAAGDLVTVNEEEEITDLRTGKRVSATEIGDTTEANVYPHGGTSHRLASHSADGSIVVLNDESVWAVSPATRATAASWTRGDRIAVPKHSHLLYRLVNTQDHTTIKASYIAEEES
jgi:hypothetical protein